MRCFGSGVAQPLCMVGAHQVVTRILEEKGGQKKSDTGAAGEMTTWTATTFFNFFQFI